MAKAKKERRNGHNTGMRGVYVAAAELAKHELIVSPTSRSAAGADLLVTDKLCTKAWSVQVKTNYGKPRFWLAGKLAKTLSSPSHIYVLINLCQNNPTQIAKNPYPQMYVVPSVKIVKALKKRRGSNGIYVDDIEGYLNRWELFKPKQKAHKAGR